MIYPNEERKMELRRDWTVETEEQLRGIIKPPAAAIRLGKTDRMGPGSQKFAACSPFVCITTRRADGLPDVSPLGGEPGLVRAVDERTLFIALDGPLHGSDEVVGNIQANAFCGLFVMIPGVNDIMRINGVARVVEDAALLGEAFGPRRRPEAAIRLEIEELWSHCPKAFIRSQIWDPETYPAPSRPTDPVEDQTVRLEKLDDRSRRHIARSPVLALGSSLIDGGADASPRGDPPGFVMVLDDETMLLPDRPGNRLADNFRNILRNPFAALLFLVPGSEEVLRVRGRVRLVKDPELLEPLSVKDKRPRLGLLVDVRGAVLERSGAIVRSGLWDPATQVERGSLPGTGEMLVEKLQPKGRFKGLKGKVADRVVGAALDRDAKKNLY